ncbi:MAG: 30S ribosomal protein S12 methylthiotransferase RimO, partial [Alistipes sp.]|nr:30S ribosomal protein S12 methylthiotransferase RimO [Alistipes sp.]
PGETEQDFEELKAFVRATKFDRLGVFAYSEEEGTYSATRLSDDVPEEVKHERVDKIMRLQERISLENNAKRIGQKMRVIIDRKEGDFYIGRSEYDSPEVDQELVIESFGKRLLRGRFYEVVITDAEDYDLYAEIIS